MSPCGPLKLITALFFISLASPALAVDSWLVADKHVIKPGGEAWIGFITGEVFPIGDGIVDPTRIEGLIDLHEGRRRPVEGLQVEDDAVAVRTTLDPPGFHILGLSLKPRVIALEGDIFDDYLRDERATEALAARQQAGNTKATVRERYTKYAKTIIEVGASAQSDQQYLQPIGHRLEIVPLSNPTRWQAGNEVGVKVLLDGHPWPNIPITAAHEGTMQGEVAVRSQTNEQGIARWRLTQSGQWFARAHFIRPVNGLVNYEWESFWTTFSFGVKGKTDVSGSMQLLRAIHGDINPWAVAGYLMGERALTELEMAFGSDRLLALHHCPQKLPFTAMLDGIQAATGATVGKLNLRLIPASESDMRCEFIDMDSGDKLTYRLTPAMFQQMLAVEDGDARALALQMMTLPEADIFISATTRPETIPPTEASEERLRPAADRSDPSTKTKIEAVNLQTHNTTSSPLPIDRAPLRIELPAGQLQSTFAGPLVLALNENKVQEHEAVNADLDKEINRGGRQMAQRPGPGEVFWRLAHRRDGRQQKTHPFPSQGLSKPEALANGR